jgi:site-specific recombinase XerD
VNLPTTARIPRLLTPNEVQSILDACERLRDRLLFALLHDAGIRIGEALGLRSVSPPAVRSRSTSKTSPCLIEAACETMGPAGG